MYIREWLREREIACDWRYNYPYDSPYMFKQCTVATFGVQCSTENLRKQSFLRKSTRPSWIFNISWFN